MAIKIQKKEPVLPSENMLEQIEYVSVDKIKLWEGNTKKHTDKSIRKLAKIIETYGQQTPITVWKGDKQIRKGNGTFLAMTKILNQKFIYVKWADFSNKAEADMYGAADNKSSEFSEVDFDMLRELFTRDDVVEFTGRNRERLQEFSGFSEEDLQKLYLEKDLKKINEEGKAIIKIECDKVIKDEIISILSQWSKDSGFDDLRIY